MFLIEHAFRLATEQGTRDELSGPFFADWFASASNLRGWRDGDPAMVNYVGHPMQGAVTGFIQIQNSPRERALTLAATPAYDLIEGGIVGFDHGHSREERFRGTRIVAGRGCSLL